MPSHANRQKKPGSRKPSNVNRHLDQSAQPSQAQRAQSTLTSANPLQAMVANSPQLVKQRSFQQAANNSSRVRQLMAIQQMAASQQHDETLGLSGHQPIQAKLKPLTSKEMKTGIRNDSGMQKAMKLVERYNNTKEGHYNVSLGLLKYVLFFVDDWISRYEASIKTHKPSKKTKRYLDNAKEFRVRAQNELEFLARKAYQPLKKQFEMNKKEGLSIDLLSHGLNRLNFAHSIINKGKSEPNSSKPNEEPRSTDSTAFIKAQKEYLSTLEKKREEGFSWVTKNKTLNTLKVDEKEFESLNNLQLEAIDEMSKTKIPEREKERAITLIIRPDMSQQGYFGTCGLVSIIRATLISNPKKFVYWVNEAMSSTTTLERSTKRWKANYAAREKKLKTKLKSQFSDSYEAFFTVRKGELKVPENESARLDFYMAQWLIAEFLEKPSENDSIQSQRLNDQRLFSNKLAEEAKIKNWEITGHFGLTGDALADIANRSLGAGGGEELIIDQTEKNGLFAAWKKATSGGRLVIAAVRGANHKNEQEVFWKFGKPSFQSDYGFLKASKNKFIRSSRIIGPYKKTESKPRPPQHQLHEDTDKSRVAFDHWVMIDSMERLKNGGLKMVIWTWGVKKTYNFKAGMATGYFHSLIAINPKPGLN